MGPPSASSSRSRLLRASKKPGRLDVRTAGPSPDRNSRTHPVAQTVAQRYPSRIQGTDGQFLPAVCRGRGARDGDDEGPDPGMDATGAGQFAWAEEEKHINVPLGNDSTGNAWRLTSKILSN